MFDVKRTKNFFVIGSVLLLSACSAAKMNITSKPVGIKQTTGYVKTGISEVQPIEIRTFTKIEKKLKEVDKVRCEVKGRDFSALVMTPGIVNIPAYGKGSPAVTTHCINSTLAGTGVAEIQNVDLINRRDKTANAAATGGLIGALIGSAITSSMKERTGDRFAYRPIVVTLTAKN